MVDSREKVFIWMVMHFRCITELVIFDEKKDNSHADVCTIPV